MITLALASAACAPLNLNLATGVNITRWFCYLARNDDTAHFEHYLGNQDFKAFKDLKLKFVRLCISPDIVYRGGQPNPRVMPYIDRAVDRLTHAGLTVLWDLHDNGQLRLDASGHDNSGFLSFWSAVAKHYAGRQERRLIFELLNEPVFQHNAEDWYALQRKTVDAVRAQDPARTVMVTSTSWSGIDTFVKMKPLPEPNLVYTYHCYDPFFFTHQGAEWVGPYPGQMRRVPFPASPDAVEQILPLNDRKFWPALRGYGKAGYDDAYLKSRIGQAVDWGRGNHVPVVLGEFGAYPKVSLPEDRAKWFQGMRKAVDAFHAANAIWGYDDGLGLGRRVNSDGTLWLDPVTLQNYFEIRK